MLIFQKDNPGRTPLIKKDNSFQIQDIPVKYLRKSSLALPSVSELQVVRHYTKLSQTNYSIDGNFYPLGSCTMKYNPAVIRNLSKIPQLLNHHPLTPSVKSQSILKCCYELQEYLTAITGMSVANISPMAGAQGELAGLAMIKAYHLKNGDTERNEILIPVTAHGTNPATAVMAGFKIIEIPIDTHGDTDLKTLYSCLSKKTAGLMLTNPSTCGLFERNILKITAAIHNAGGLNYYDGANFNAIIGRVRPKDMGFDIMHMNLHKTFATPHGSGGPGSGAIAANKKLQEFLPIPFVIKEQEIYRLSDYKDCPNTIGRLSAFMGNTMINLMAYLYIKILGSKGLRQVSNFSVLNANYLAKCLSNLGVQLAYPQRLATHEFIISLKNFSNNKLTAWDFAKRLLDFGIHPPTTYFPLIVPECWLIEPTETEDKQTLDYFINVVKQLIQEAKQETNLLHNAPCSLNIKRVNEVQAARNLDINYLE